jgi:CRISPR/Cas system-associated exonuclease Cas4 (RecB family)
MGSVVHAMLEAVAKEKDWTVILDKVKKEYSQMMDEEKEYYGDIPTDSKRIISGYNRMWAKEQVSYKLIEKSLGPIPLTSKTAFELRPDRLMTERGTRRTFLCETKTGRKIPQEDLRIWDLQTALYVWALRELGYKVDGILWDYIRTKPPTVPVLLKSGQLSQRADMDTDFATYAKAVYDNDLNMDDYKVFLETLKGRESTYYRRVKVPITEQMIVPVLEDARQTSLEILYLKDDPVRSMSGYTCPRCSYQSLCYAHLRNLDEKFIRDVEFMNREEEVEYAIEEESD